MAMQFDRIWVALAGLVAGTLLLAGCNADGGGGGGDVRETGSVAIMLTDAPSADFDAVEITLTEILLLSDRDPVRVFSGEETIDLLELRSHATLFALVDDVPAGRFNKIRLRVARVTLIRRNADGSVAESIDARLPANGKIDLNPRGPFTVFPDELLLVQLDIDAEKSLHLRRDGAGRWHFRPVVFVTVISAQDTGRLLRVSGTVRALDEDRGEFTLCRDGRRHCVHILITPQTGLFGPGGLPTEVTDIVVGEPLTVIGTWHHADPAAGAGSASALARERPTVTARVIEIGPPGAFARLRGEAAAAVSDTGRFPFALDPAQGFGTGSVLATQLQAGTGIFSHDGEALPAAGIVAGTRAVIDGVVALPEAEAPLLRAALVVLEATAATRLSGLVAALEPQLILATDAGDRCIESSDDVAVLLVDDGSSREGSLLDLALAQRTDAYGTETIGGCLAAHTLVAFTGP